MTADKFGTYLGWIIAAATLIFSWYKLRLETPGARADLAAKYHAMAITAANNETAMKSRVDVLEERLDGFEVQLKEAEDYIKLMDEWAAEVVAVLQSLKITMIKPKPERKTTPR